MQTNPSLLEETGDEELTQFVEMLKTPYTSVQFQGLLNVRSFLSSDENPPIHKVINAGVVPMLLEFMNKEDNPTFQCESTWAITNICAGASEYVKHIVDLGAIDLILSQLNSNSEEVVDQALWATANITGDSLEYRDIFLDKGCVDIIIEILKKFNSFNVFKSATWAISNLARGKPYPEWNKISKVLPILHQIIQQVQFPEVVSNALWGISYLSDMRIEEVIDEGCVPSLVNHFCDDTLTVLAPSMRALGNLVSGDDDNHTEVIVNCQDFIPRLFELFTHRKRVIKKEAFWTLSNIAAGNQRQIDLILKHPNWSKAIKKAVKKEPFEVAHEAILVLSNMISGASGYQLNKIISAYGYQDCLETVIKTVDYQSKGLALESILKLLGAGKRSLKQGLPVIILQDEELMRKIKKLSEKEELECLSKSVLEYFAPFQETTSNDGEYEETEDEWVDA